MIRAAEAESGPITWAITASLGAEPGKKRWTLAKGEDGPGVPG